MRTQITDIGMDQAIEIILEQEQMTKAELAEMLEITPGMVSHYSHRGHYPSLKVATRVYKLFGIQVEPFTEAALKRAVYGD